MSLIQDHIILDLVGLEKTSKPGKVRGYLHVQRFSDDPSLCPMDTLIEYFNRVSSKMYFSILKYYFRLGCCLEMIAHHFLSLINFHINLLEPRLCQDGRRTSSASRVLTSLPSSLMRRDQQLEFFTANHWVLSRFVNWPIGPQRVESTESFINDICNLLMCILSFCILLVPIYFFALKLFLSQRRL